MTRSTCSKSLTAVVEGFPPAGREERQAASNPAAKVRSNAVFSVVRSLIRQCIS